MYGSDGCSLVQASQKDGKESQWLIVKRGCSFEKSSELENKEKE